MKVKVNDHERELPDGATVAELLRTEGMADKPCAVEVNRALVPKRKHGEHALRDGDRVEIVTLVGGG